MRGAAFRGHAYRHRKNVSTEWESLMHVWVWRGTRVLMLISMLFQFWGPRDDPGNQMSTDAGVSIRASRLTANVFTWCPPDAAATVRARVSEARSPSCHV